MRRSYAKSFTAAMMAEHRFSCDPANCYAFAKRRNKPLFLFAVGGSCVYDFQIRATMDCKTLSLCEHSSKRWRKCGSDTHVLVIHHSTTPVASPRATVRSKMWLGKAASIQAKKRESYLVPCSRLPNQHENTVWFATNGADALASPETRTGGAERRRGTAAARGVWQ